MFPIILQWNVQNIFEAFQYPAFIGCNVFLSNMILPYKSIISNVVLRGVLNLQVIYKNGAAGGEEG